MSIAIPTFQFSNSIYDFGVEEKKRQEQRQVKQCKFGMPMPCETCKFFIDFRCTLEADH